MTELTLLQAQQGLGALVQRAATLGERVTITDGDDRAAVLMGAEELADLEEELALARYRARQAESRGISGVPHDEVKARLGLSRA